MKKLIPSFLKRLDQYLLLNHPLIWISKIHYILFYGVLLNAVSALIGWTIPLDLIYPQDLALWYFLFSVISVVILCFWIYRVVIFNIEKKFGNRKWTDEYKVFFLNFICVFTLFSFPFPFATIYNARVANYVNDSVLINDINTLNKAEAYMVNELGNYSSYYDTIDNKDYYDIRSFVQYDVNTPWHIKGDTDRFRDLMSYYQLKLNYYKANSKTAIVKSIEDAFEVQKRYGLLPQPFDGDAQKLYSRYLELCKVSPVTWEVYNKEFAANSNSYTIQKIVANISEAKFRPLFLWEKEFLWTIFYACFYVSVLLMLFKMVNWRQFLITIVALIIIPILLFIITQLLPYDYSIGNYNYRSNAFMLLSVILFFICLVFTVKGSITRKHFSAFDNICTQLFYITFPFFPLIILVLLKQMFGLFGSSEYFVYDGSSDYNSFEYIYEQLMMDYWSRQYHLWLTIMMYGGIGLFIVILMPLLKQSFVKQLALPRKK